MSDPGHFHGPNLAYLLELYERYKHDPQSVDPETRAYFAGWQPDAPEEAVASAEKADENAAPLIIEPMPPISPESMAATPTLDIHRIVGAARLIRYIRELGHLAARIDPLGSAPPGDPGLELKSHHVTPADLASLPAEIVRGPLVRGSANALEAVARLRQAYSGSIGYETDHIQVYAERDWIRQAAEDRRFFADLDNDRHRELLDRLTEVETFERFLHRTFVGQKRFSIEGSDMTIPVIDAIIRNAAAAGTREVVIGMAHRGRLNVLAHILGKHYREILTEFHSPDYTKDSYLGWTGDVKYHLGARKAYRESGVLEMPITLAPNPSHLEYVNPVVEGRARAAQERRNRPGYPEEDEKEALAVLIHGDAAFPGQGIVAETLNLSRLPGYSTGGTIHLIINNQIGFTTNANASRSTLYASDLARGFEIPIVHVNADDAAACIAVARMAWAYRERFQKDFLIDLVGYRRYGHNEGDEPEFTQPEMYSQIKNHPTVREIWARELVRRGLLTSEEVEARVKAAQDKLQRTLEEVRSRSENAANGNGHRIEHLAAPDITPEITVNPVSEKMLVELNEALLERPEGFQVHPKLERMLQQRRDSIFEPGGIDWGHAETLAFAMILASGTPIRLSGQDSERGTFSQRHAVLHDVNTGEQLVPLHHLPQARASFAIYNSPLSENATLGFEYGYSTHAPDTLVLWEAQFGDFANGAQVIIDQFIVSGHAKWGQEPSLVLLLPHGYEGQGPEHSSARIERFLQQAATNNIRVANCTTAAQYFHILRRQAAMLGAYPRPLILMTPKSLLRHPLAASTISDFDQQQFQPVLAAPANRDADRSVSRLVLCSGKIGIDLLAGDYLARAEQVAMARLEELYPFPARELKDLLARYPRLQEVVWMQEEPQNMGAWSYIEPRLRALLDPDISLAYAGRTASASPSEGLHSQHKTEQKRILEEAVFGNPESVEALKG